MSTQETTIQPVETNRYQLHEPLGQGGMGIVFRATDHLTGDDVALKQVYISRDNLTFNSHQTDEVGFDVALALEFQSIASLKHPNIIRVLDYGFDLQKRPFFTMTLLQDAKPITDACQDCTFEQKVILLAQLLDAVAYLHQRDIIHRDLKPTNVLVQAGQAYVLDFGLAVRHDAAQKRVGSLMYMSPEVLRTGVAVPQSDQYAIGMIAYEMFSGNYPFPRRNPTRMMAAILQTNPDLSKLDVPIIDVIARLLHKDPAERYPTIHDALADLQPYLPDNYTDDSLTRESFLQAATFVGRKKELKHLTDALKAIIAGQMRMFLIAGESGVGKSRLIEELRIRALVQGVRVVSGQAVEQGGFPYHLLRTVIRPLILMNDLPLRTLSVLKEIVPDIDTLCGLSVPLAPVLEGQAQAQRLGDAIITCLQQQQTPLLIILEDMQWVIESRALIQRIVRELHNNPILIVGAFRNDEAPTLPDDFPQADILTLSRLNADDIKKLSGSMLGDAGQRPQVIDFLMHETEGNTFFLVEVVRALAEEAGSLHDVGSMTLRPQILTGGIQKIVQRRLAKVATDYQPILKLAAVIGRNVDTTLLAHHADAQAIENWIFQAVNVAVLTQAGEIITFAHDKLREQVLHDLSPDEKIILHQQAAEAIEAAYPDKIEEYGEDLVHHWQAAQQPERMLPYLPTVIRTQQRFGFMDEAQESVQLGLDTVQQAETTDENRHHQLKLTLLSGDVLQGISQYQQAQGKYEQAQQLAESLNHAELLIDSLLGLSQCMWRQGSYEQAREISKRGLALAEKHHYAKGKRKLITNLGTVSFIMGDLEPSEQYLEQALRLAQQQNDQATIAQTLANLSVMYTAKKDYATAEMVLLQGLKLARAIGDQWLTARFLNNLGVITFYTDKLDESNDYYQQSLDIRYRIQDIQGISAIQLNLSWNDLKIGQLDATRQQLAESLQISYDFNIRLLLFEILGCVAAFAYYKGHIDAALPWLGFVLNHPSTSIDTFGMLESHIEKIQHDLGETVYNERIEAGKTLEFETVVAAMQTFLSP